MNKKWRKNTKKYSWNFFYFFFWSKTAISLFLGLHIGRPSYRPTTENIQHFKKWNLLTFFCFVGNFCPPVSGSGLRIRIRIRIQGSHWIRIRIRIQGSHWIRIRIQLPHWIRIQYGSGDGSKTLVQGKTNPDHVDTTMDVRQVKIIVSHAKHTLRTGCQWYVRKKVYIRTWTPPCWPSAWTCRRRYGRGCRSRGAQKTRRTPPRPATSRTRLRTQPDPRTIIQPVFVSQAGKQCSGSVIFWYGSGCGCGSSDPYFWLNATKNIFKYLFMFKKIKFKSFKIIKNILTIKIKFFATKFFFKIWFCNHYYSPLNTFMRKRKDMESDSDPLVTNGSGCGSARPKNIQIRIRIPNTAKR